jgi:hypothetical protein
MNEYSLKERLGMENVVISASRIGDPVAVYPDTLVSILTGKQECRLSGGGLGRPGMKARLDLDNIHTLVLWTKDPKNILDYRPLRNVLGEFVKDHNGLIYLQLTVTGLGGTFIEYNIPKPVEVSETLGKIFDSGLVFRDAVKLRFDPVLKVKLDGHVISNMRIEIFEEIISAFSSMGVEEVTTSRIIAGERYELGGLEEYQFVRRKFEELGIEPLPIPDCEAVKFVTELNRIAAKYGMDFDVCCDPYGVESVKYGGCIDGRRLNYLMRRHFGSERKCSEKEQGTRRKVKGVQRCKCTQSYDIGYSTGVRKCYPCGRGCVYCYAQSRLSTCLKQKILLEIEKFKSDPEGYFSELPNFENMGQYLLWA